MSQKDKLKDRLFSKPKDFTYDEAKSLLIKLGCEEYTKGKTSGSRLMFYHKKTDLKFCLHRPHPDGSLKNYAINELISFVEEIEYE